MLSFYELYHLINEGYKEKKDQFLKDGDSSDNINSYFDKFKIITKNPNKTLLQHNVPNLIVPIVYRLNIDKYPNLEQLKIFIDYYEKQLEKTDIKFDTVEFSGEPLLKANGLEIYYANTPKACIKLKGNIPYSWCIARDHGNRFYAYRFNEDKPSFYFIKNIEKTKKEFEQGFDGQFKDKYHFFVLQVLKNANIDNTEDKQYIITSAANDDNLKVSWSEILEIEPRLNGLQKEFYPQLLSADQEKLIDKYLDGLSDEEFALLTDKEKSFYIDIRTSNKKEITDEQFNTLSSELKNYYINTRIGLNNEQYKTIKDKPNLMKRYAVITIQKIKDFIDGGEDFDFTDTEYEVIKNNMNDELLNKINTEAEYAFNYAKYGLRWIDVPKKLINNFIKKPYYALEYAKYGLKGIKVPLEVINSIIQVPSYALDYAKYVLKGKDVPPEIINSIVEKPVCAFYYARDVLKWRNVDDKVINSFIKTPEYACYYAQHVLKGNKIDPEILNTINSDPYYKNRYEIFLSNKHQYW